MRRMEFHTERSERGQMFGKSDPGHAIEYLTDEYVHKTKSLSATDPQVAPIRLLMSLNRQVYYECPVIPTFAERCHAFFRKLGI
jgi:hypothetical protein